MTRPLLLALLVALLPQLAQATGPVGYYRQPTLRSDTIVFVAEGDLWRVPATGGTAVRLTTHPAAEEYPTISPDGRTVAFTAEYEGPRDIYTMSVDGGLPTRHTWGDARFVRPAGWSLSGELLVATSSKTTLPGVTMARLDLSKHGPSAPPHVPLFDAIEGTYAPDGTLFFTRYWSQPSHTKRYKGGTAQSIWKFEKGATEATPLTASYTGTSRQPMWWNGRVYFVSDRDGTMNLWSMNPGGGDVKQHTSHAGWDVEETSLDSGRIVYRVGADLWLYDIATNATAKIDITLRSDLDQTRVHWVEKPMDYLSAAHISPDGQAVALTSRGQVFVAPRKQGRLVEIPRTAGVRYRAARFMPDGESLVLLSDESDEVELWTVPARGVGESKQLTTDGQILRWEGIPSPNGRYIAHTDKLQRLFLYDTKTGKNEKIDENRVEQFSGIAWSPDSKWLAYVWSADNLFRQIKVMHVKKGDALLATSDRFDSFSPAWSPDGKWLYFLSDRHLETVVPNPWGNYAPQPFLDKKTEIYALALRPGQRFPFDPSTELDENESDGSDEKDDDKAEDDGKAPKVHIELDGLRTRLHKVPAPAGNYSGLTLNAEALFFLSRPAGEEKSDLQYYPIKNADASVGISVSKVEEYEMSGDGKAILVKQDDKLSIIDAKPAAATLDKAAVDLGKWKMSLVPREEWQQMFDDAWRLERDYFYDRNMHGVDWVAMRKKYQPLVSRVTSRAELADLVAQMVSELSALHTYVYGGEMREGPYEIDVASLGAGLEPDAGAGGWRITHIYLTDPDKPDELSPLGKPGLDLEVGDVITKINGQDTLSVPTLGVLLRNQVGRQVLLHVKEGRRKERPVIVTPLSESKARSLRYREWEYTRRQRVEKQGQGELGYLHLRAMGRGNYTEWAEGYYPVFDRKGLIIDVRHNGGGNIDSWILGRLLQRPWMYWSLPVGNAPVWNMQYGFRGHIVVLCDAWTASDGEAFAEGIKRLGLGTVIGVRTWGGEIWLTSSNRLRDKGIATAAEFGVYADGEWLIEGHGVEPDIVVDNLPHATFKGEDAQLEAAIEYLQKKIAAEPVPEQNPPPFPNKSATN